MNGKNGGPKRSSPTIFAWQKTHCLPSLGYGNAGEIQTSSSLLIVFCYREIDENDGRFADGYWVS
jgi:hypothetical protein